MNRIEPLPLYAPAIRCWLLTCIALVVLMVAIGGVTRLTESGLSIVEWKLVSGTVPPLTGEAWQQEFDSYKTSPQFLKVNKSFSVGEFKQIFWLEYLHRLLGRIIGMVILLGTFYFGIRKRFTAALLWRMLGICVLVGAQGTVGWIMVASGLNTEPRVEPIKLGLHLLLAFALFAALLWTYWQVKNITRPIVQKPIPYIARGVLAFLILQIFFGALVAGLRAGLTYNTYPLMDGQWIPDGLYLLSPWWKNHLENPLTVQFQHRMIAIAVVLGIVGLILAAWRKVEAWLLKVLAGVVFLQFTLGVATLLSVVNLWLASAHQLGALLLFAVLMRITYATPLDANQYLGKNSG